MKSAVKPWPRRLIVLLLFGGIGAGLMMTVLNKKGEIVHRHVGLHHPITETIAAITRTAQP